MTKQHNKNLITTSSKRSSRIVIISGFSLVLLLLVALIILAAYSIKNNSNRIMHIVNEQREVANIFAMRDAAHNRALLLYRMASVDDPFDRDSMSLEFSDHAVKFIQARDQLLSDLDNDSELKSWNEVRPYIAEGGLVQNNTVKLILADDIKQANHMLATQVIPTQDRVMDRLTKMLDQQNEVINSELQSTQTTNQRFLFAITALGLIGIILGMSITSYVTNHNAKTESALQQQQKLAEAANQAKTDFLANMSHEIRTPLTAIIGFSESLLNDDIDKTARDRTNRTIMRNGELLQQIINDVLDLSKIEAGQLEIETLPVSPIQIIDEVTEIISLRANKKNLACNIEYEFPLPEIIYTDTTRIKQILINLCGNAIKFTPSGHITIKTSFDITSAQIQFEVIDTGIGMSPEEVDHIFNPFTQADSSTTRKYGGTGLGLSISKQLAKKLGGDLTCESAKGRGSQFRITIAAGDTENRRFINNLDEHEYTITVKSEATIKPLQGNILLAEDNTENQQLISMYINKTGADLDIVNNGQQALEQGLAKDYDLILMDMQMPIMDGVESISLLRQAGYDNPIVSLTANAMKSDRDKCIIAGANDYLVKPVDLKKFYAVLNQYLLEDSGIKQRLGFDNDPDFQALVGRFVNKLPDMSTALFEASREPRDWAIIESISHRLKGMGGSFGFPEITSLSDEINVKAIVHDDNQISELVCTLKDLCDSIVQSNKMAS